MANKTLRNYSRFVLLDANIVAGYYLPESLNSIRAREHIRIIIDAVKSGGDSETFLYIPNFCIPEVFSVFNKYYFARRLRQVRKNLPTKLKKADYERITTSFRNDLHNGAILQKLELNSYHILATDLISPVDANYEHYRHYKTTKTRRNKKMMGASDHSIIGMGINLSRLHGRDNFALLTADHRLADILLRATSVRHNTAEKLGLLRTANELGLDYCKEIYPRVINLAKTTKKQLSNFFDVWPLPIEPIIKKPLMRINKEDCEILAKLRKKSGIGRDSLPYTDTFELICKEFERIKSQAVDRHTAWMAIGRAEKKGSKKSKHKN